MPESAPPRRGPYAADHDAALERLLRQRRAAATRTVTADRSAPFEVSPFQEGFWFENQLSPQTRVHNLLWGVELKGPVNEDVLERSIRAIVSRHEVLRSAFRFDKERERILQSVVDHELRLRLIDLRGRARAEILAARGAFGAELFDLERGPLIRACLARVDGAARLWFACHHIVFDGSSGAVLMSELALVYPLIANGRDPARELRSLELQYADCAAIHRVRAEEAVRKDLAFWKTYLGGVPNTELPPDKPRGARARGKVLAFRMDERVYEGTLALARRLGVTDFGAHLAAFLLLISRRTGRNDLVVTILTNHRDIPGSRRLIGTFVNRMLLRVSFSDQDTFDDLVLKTQASIYDVLAHPSLPAARITRALRRPAAAETPCIVFAMDPSARDVRLGPLVTSPDEVDGESVRPTRFDLTFRLCERGGRLEGRVHYDPDLYLSGTITRLADSYATLLEAVLKTPGGAVRRIRRSIPAPAAPKG